MELQIQPGSVRDGSRGLTDAAGELDRARSSLQPNTDVNIGPLSAVHADAIHRVCGAMAVGSAAATEIHDNAGRFIDQLGEVDHIRAGAFTALTPSSSSDH